MSATLIRLPGVLAVVRWKGGDHASDTPDIETWHCAVDFSCLEFGLGFSQVDMNQVSL